MGGYGVEKEEEFLKKIFFILVLKKKFLQMDLAKNSKNLPMLPLEFREVFSVEVW
jgi:hypothetical protein